MNILHKKVTNNFNDGFNLQCTVHTDPNIDLYLLGVTIKIVSNINGVVIHEPRKKVLTLITSEQKSDQNQGIELLTTLGPVNHSLLHQIFEMNSTLVNNWAVKSRSSVEVTQLLVDCLMWYNQGCLENNRVMTVSITERLKMLSAINCLY